MRAEPTLAEATLWTALRASKLGVKFRRQHALGQFIVDFYARDADLVVEVDGAVHKTQRAQDDARDAILRDMGLVVLRFSNDEVFTDLEWVLKALRGTIAGRATR